MFADYSDALEDIAVGGNENMTIQSLEIMNK